jgi:hypothetical protein
VLAGSSFDAPTSVNGIDTIGPRHFDNYSKTRIRPVHACVEAQIDIYHNTAQKQWWADRYVFWLRAISPDLKPWSADGTIFDTNPQLIDADHPLRKLPSGRIQCMEEPSTTSTNGGLPTSHYTSIAVTMRGSRPSRGLLAKLSSSLLACTRTESRQSWL